MAQPRCRNCGGTKWTTAGPPDQRGRCAECREFPTLGWEVIDWIEDRCAIPDRFVAGDPFLLADWQKVHLLREYRVWPTAIVDLDKPSAPFAYFGNYLVKPQKAGKGPFSASRICAQAEGPVLFGGWDADGQPVGMPWASPHIQVTAVSGAQTANIWRALMPMIEMGSIAAEIDDLGLSRINLAGGGLIEPVTASARSRLGQRITYAEQDETQSWTEINGGHELADNQRRNLAGTGGRWSASGNAWDPTQKSVMQMDSEAAQPGVFFNYEEPPKGSWKNKRERRRILKHVYAGSPWVDIDRIEADADRLAAKGDPGQAERYFGNRIVAGADKAYDIQRWDELARPKRRAAKKALITIGVDGARFVDALGMVATHVRTGHQWPLGIWERPDDADGDYEHPVGEIDAAFDDAMEHFTVWRAYVDPQWIDHLMTPWQGRYGEKKVLPWLTHRIRQSAWAVRSYSDAIAAGGMSHNGDKRFARHIGNAVKQLVNVWDDDEQQMHIIAKDRPKSPRKIDGAMAAILSWEARNDAIAAGALDKKSPGKFVSF